MPDARTWNTLDEELDQCCAFVAGISLEGQGRLPFRACLKCLKREESLALVIVSESESDSESESESERQRRSSIERKRRRRWLGWGSWLHLQWGMGKDSHRA